jgi:hypothetical protein
MASIGADWPIIEKHSSLPNKATSQIARWATSVVGRRLESRMCSFDGFACLMLAPLYGPAVRCKLDLNKWRVVLRFCIRPLHGAIVLLAIMDIRAHPISF